MSAGAAGAAGAAAAAKIAQAIKASGTLVKVEPADFLRLLNAQPHSLVVSAEPGGIITFKHKYLTSYKGLTFYAETETPLKLPDTIERIVAKKIWMPS